MIVFCCDLLLVYLFLKGRQYIYIFKVINFVRICVEFEIIQINDLNSFSPQCKLDNLYS